MAATDIQYGGLDPVLYTPDFTFLRYVLDKKTSLYEKGLKSASSAYNNLKRETSDPVNAQKRDQYLKDAQSQLQKIAGADLSLQQNVNFANSIFDPIATDKAFVFDTYHTARIKDELQKEEDWKNSENPEQRKKYNGEIAEWVNRDLESLKTGQGNIANYKVQNRSAQAYIDAQDILEKEAKRQGFKMKVDELGSPYIVTVEGGPGFAPNYETFANNVLANDQVYQRQAGILGQNRAEKVLEKYRTDPKYAPIWANKSTDEIYKDAAITSFDKNRTSQKEYIEALNKNLTAETSDINAALNGPDSAKYIKGASDIAAGNNTTPEASMYLAIKERADNRNNLNTKLKDIQTDYDNTYGTGKQTDELRENYIKKFTNDPAGYFADLQFKNDVTRFSNIKSSFYTRTIKEDRAVVDMTVAKTNAMATIAKMEDIQHDNDLADKKLNLDERKEDFKESLKGKKVKNADGTYSVVEPEIKLIDQSATQLTTTQALNDMKSKVTMASVKALDNVTSNFGSFYMLQSMGMDQTKVGTLRGMFSRYFETDDKTQFKPTADENKALSEAYTKLSAFAKNNPKNTFLDQENAAQASGSRKKSGVTIGELPDLLDRAMTGYQTQNDSEIKAKTAMVEYKNNSAIIQMTNAALEKGKKVVIETLKKDSTFNGMFTADGKDIIGVKDIEKQVPKMSQPIWNRKNWGWDPAVAIDDLTKKQIATEYINGTLKVNITKAEGAASAARSGGSTVGSTSVSLSDGRHFEFAGDNVFKITPEKYKNLYTRINERIPVPTFQNATGTVSSSPAFKLTGQVRQDVIDDLSLVTLTNSNIFEYATGTSTGSQVGAGEQNDVRRDILKKENVASVNLFTASPLNNGGQAVAVTFNTETGSKDKPAPSWSGKTYYFPITPSPSSPKVFHIFSEVNEASEYEVNRQKGTPYTIDTFHADGAYAEIYPNQPGSNNGTIRFYYKPYNPTTKTYSDQFVQYDKDMEFSLGDITFPEIKQNIYNDFIYPYVQGTLDFKKQVQANTISSGGTPVTAQTLTQTLIH